MGVGEGGGVSGGRDGSYTKVKTVPTLGSLVCFMLKNNVSCAHFLLE